MFCSPTNLKCLMKVALQLILVVSRVAVVVQKSVRVCTLYHLHEDGGEFALQSQKTLESRNVEIPPIDTY